MTVKVLRIAGWLLTVVGILWAIYGGFQFSLGVVHTIKGPERTAPLTDTLTGGVLFGMGAVVAWGGRRLRRVGLRGGARGGR